MVARSYAVALVACALLAEGRLVLNEKKKVGPIREQLQEVYDKAAHQAQGLVQQQQQQANNFKNEVQKDVNLVEQEVAKDVNLVKQEVAKDLNLVNHAAADQMEKANAVMRDLHRISTYSFQDFIRDYGRTYQPGTEEYKLAEKAFQTNINRVLAHNMGVPSVAWVGGINKFMDHTPEMLQDRLGYKGRRTQGAGASSFVQMVDQDIELPEAFEWRSRLGATRDFHRDQGSCGSCWAVAAAQVLEDHISLRHNVSVQLSEQALVSCTPNLLNCGGTGGCKGATAELAFEYVKNNGIPAHAHMPYTSGGGSDGTCDSRAQLKHVRIGGYVQLPENQDRPLLQALYQHGPAVISVDASNWFMYNGGTFAGCDRDATINHAVVAEGFGKEHSNLDGNDHKYYLIKNSWGADWGEQGYIKLERFDKDDAHCGTDHHPEEGTGCDGGPSEVHVCGMCGMLYDSAFPTDGEFVNKADGGTYIQGESPSSKWNPLTLKEKPKIQWSAYQMPFGSK